ncbi:hypothetical protein RDI58_019834 [Solanum bulbocastanum]|uniref:Uncharacterized protein n=1 Tax=Solanum bulbocastanum TaxID=147425 RepID=A0AAN8YA26_SOLBU
MSLGHFKMIIVGMKEVKRTMPYTGDEDALIWRVHIVRRHLKNRLVISSELSAYHWEPTCACISFMVA